MLFVSVQITIKCNSFQKGNKDLRHNRVDLEQYVISVVKSKAGLFKQRHPFVLVINCQGTKEIHRHRMSPVEI